MTTEQREKLKNKIKIFLESVDNDCGDDGQILIIYYDNTGIGSNGFGCPACASEAAAKFIYKNIDSTHTTEDDLHAIKH